jgi:hypothetical protein
MRPSCLEGITRTQLAAHDARYDSGLLAALIDRPEPLVESEVLPARSAVRVFVQTAAPWAWLGKIRRLCNHWSPSQGVCLKVCKTF